MEYAEKLLDIKTIQSGKALSKFNAELRNVLENIADENTSPTAKRKITLTLEIKPDEKRQTGTAVVNVKSYLAPVIPEGTNIVFKREYNELRAYEKYNQQLNDDWEEAMSMEAINE